MACPGAPRNPSPACPTAPSAPSNTAQPATVVLALPVCQHSQPSWPQYPSAACPGAPSNSCTACPTAPDAPSNSLPPAPWLPVLPVTAIPPPSVYPQPQLPHGSECHPTAPGPRAVLAQRGTNTKRGLLGLSLSHPQCSGAVGPGHGAVLWDQPWAGGTMIWGPHCGLGCKSVIGVEGGRAGPWGCAAVLWDCRALLWGRGLGL